MDLLHDLCAVKVPVSPNLHIVRINSYKDFHAIKDNTSHLKVHK